MSANTSKNIPQFVSFSIGRVHKPLSIDFYDSRRIACSSYSAFLHSTESFSASAVPLPPEIIAPACPIRLPACRAITPTKPKSYHTGLLICSFAPTEQPLPHRRPPISPIMTTTASVSRIFDRRASKISLCFEAAFYRIAARFQRPSTGPIRAQKLSSNPS